MADVDNLVKWIPLVFIIFSVFFVISAIYIGGLRDITTDIDTYDREKFRLAVILENTVTLSDNEGKTGFKYEHRRGAIPAKTFTKKISGDETEKLGYATNGPHCYIPKVSGLDGENYGFQVPQSHLDKMPNKCGCYICNTPDSWSISSPIIILNGSIDSFQNQKITSEIYIYEIE